MEITEQNLKQQALKAYYDYKLKESERLEENSRKFEIQKLKALEELKAKFPGVKEEANGIFDILGYKFGFGWSWVFTELVGHFYGFNKELPHCPTKIDSLEKLGKVFNDYTAATWNKSYYL